MTHTIAETENQFDSLKTKTYVSNYSDCVNGDIALEFCILNKALVGPTKQNMKE